MTDYLYMFTIWSPTFMTAVAILVASIYRQPKVGALVSATASFLGFAGFVAQGVAAEFQSTAIRILSKAQVLDYGNGTLTPESVRDAIATLDSSLFISSTQLQTLEMQSILLLYAGIIGMALSLSVTVACYLTKTR